MDFEDRAPADALGWQLAHSLPFEGGTLAKGHRLTEADLARLGAAARLPVSLYCLNPGDMEEDAAARLIGAALAGRHLRAAAPVHGRVDLFAEADGLLCLAASQPAGLGGYPAALATRRGDTPVRRGEKVASLKVIPFALDAREAETLAASATALTLAPFEPFTALLIDAGTAGGDKLRRVTEARLATVGGRLVTVTAAPFTRTGVADGLAKAAASAPDVILIAGKAAITDPRDIVPAALAAAGGSLTQLGLAVDPGNLLMLGRLGDALVIGMPGCARSPARNGLDLVLERFAARLPVDGPSLAAFGAGGLLEPGRPRIEGVTPTSSPEIAALVLAAGSSRRAGSANKLTSRIEGETVLARSLKRIAEASVTSGNILVVTGHDSAATSAIAAASGAVVAHNPDHAKGMSTSLKAGLATLPECDWFLLALGDMPFIRPDTIRTLVKAATEAPEADICVPVFAGRRGHPVLWRHSMKAELMTVEGDRGGKAVMAAHEARLMEVPVDDPGILIDLDTPELLSLFGALTEAP